MSNLQDTLRTAATLARRARMKARIEAWWHAEHCPNCRAKRDMMAALQGKSSAEGIRELMERGDVKVLHVGKLPDTTKH